MSKVYIAAWISTGAAVIAGIYFTGSALCLLGLILPCAIMPSEKKR